MLYIKEKGKFMDIDKLKGIEGFLRALYGNHLAKNKEYIDFRIIDKNKDIIGSPFVGNIKSALEVVKQYEPQGNVFFGVMPRVSNTSGTKKDIKHINCLYLDVDVGKQGHKKKSIYQDKDSFLKDLKKFDIQPSIIIDSGNGFHLYWLLKKIIPIEDIFAIENTMRGLSSYLGGDTTQDITRPLRIPNTRNWKTDPPGISSIYLFDNALRYDFEDFSKYNVQGEKVLKKSVPMDVKLSKQRKVMQLESLGEYNINPFVLSIIKYGDPDGKYISRSERDQAVITELVLKKVPLDHIQGIFCNSTLSISDKYLESGWGGDYYLRRSIGNAKTYLSTIKPVVTNKSNQFPVDRGLKDFIKEWFDKKLMPWESSEYERVDGRDVVTWTTKTKKGNSQETKIYEVSKTVYPEGKDLPLEYMKEAFLTSLYLAFKHQTDEITFKISNKLKLIGKTKFTPEEREARRWAEVLLANTRYHHYTTKKGKKSIEFHHNLYASQGIDHNTGIIYVALNRKVISPDKYDLGTGIVSVPFYQLEIPLRNGNRFDTYKRESLSKFMTYFSGYRSDLSLNVMTHLKDIGVKKYELDRPGTIMKIWEQCVKPSITEAGHTILKIDKSKGQKNPKNWTIKMLLAVRQVRKKVKSGNSLQKSGNSLQKIGNSLQDFPG